MNYALKKERIILLFIHSHQSATGFDRSIPLLLCLIAPFESLSLSFTDYSLFLVLLSLILLPILLWAYYLSDSTLALDFYYLTLKPIIYYINYYYINYYYYITITEL